MATPEVEWYVALFEEDCLRVMKLLKDYPGLLKVGWDSEPSRMVEGSPQSHFNPRTRRPWTGRTAVHVSARRGCVELLNQILELFNLKGTNQSTGPGAALFSSTQVEQSRSIEGANRQGSSLADASHDYVESEGAPRILGKTVVAAFDGVEIEGTVRKRSSIDADASHHDAKRSESNGADRKGKRIAVAFPNDAAASEGNHKAMRESAQPARTTGLVDRDHLGGRLRKAVSTELGSSLREDGDSTQATAQVAALNWRKQIEIGKAKWTQRAFARRPTLDVIGKGNDNTLNQNAALVPSPRPDSRSMGEGGGRLMDTAGSVESAGFSLEDLQDIILRKDGEYKLDALAMATLYGNLDLINLLYAIRRTKYDPQDIHVPKLKSPTRRQGQEDTADEVRNRGRLRQATEEVMESLGSTVSSADLDEYCRHRDFHFLPLEEYLFHFSFTRSRTANSSSNFKLSFQKAFWKKVRSLPNSPWRFALELRDGQGRTPLHVAVDEGMWRADIMTIFRDGGRDETDVVTCAVTALDGAGRTPLHRAAAIGNSSAVERIVKMGSSGQYDRISATCHEGWKHSINHVIPWRAVDHLCQIDGFGKLDDFKVAGGARPCPLHAAIIHKNYACAKHLIGSKNFRDDIYYRHAYGSLANKGSGEGIVVELDNMELACLVEENWDVISFILEKGYKATSKQFSKRNDGGAHYSILTHPWKALHIVAALGNYKMLKAFVDDPQSDPFMEDFEGNNALHYALKEPFQFIEPSLLDYVSCQHVLSNSRPPKSKNTKKDENLLVERQGCVNLLLQVGCDIFKANQKKQVPYPQGSLSSNVTFLSWWYEKQAKEIGGLQSNLNIAGNAVTVTATLVATASFVGPLQPPLGLVNNQLQDENSWVAIFIFVTHFRFILQSLQSFFPSSPPSLCPNKQ